MPSVKQSFEMLVFQHVCGENVGCFPTLNPLTVEAKSMGLGEQRRGSFTHTRVYLFLTPNSSSMHAKPRTTEQSSLCCCFG